MRNVATGCVLLSLFGSMPASAATKRALLIGIDQYVADSVPDLAGAGHDVDLMASVLETRFEVPRANVRVLRNEQATRAAILSAIRTHLIEPSQPDDVVILHYAGHGSQMPDPSAEELDHYDETIVPHDSRTGSVYDITDDELNALLLELSRRTKNVTLVFDSCHSGTVSRALTFGAVARQAPPDRRRPPTPARGTRALVEGPSDLAADGYVLVSGSRADERSYELEAEGKRHGALTFYLAQALRAAPTGATWRDVMDQVGANVTARFAEQHPQLDGARLDARLFGDVEPAPDPFVLVAPATDGVELDGGESIGLAVGMKLDIYAPATKKFDGTAGRIARAEVTEVEPFRARAKLVEGGPVPAQSRAALAAFRPGGFRLGVLVEDPASSPVLAGVKADLGKYEAVDLDAGPADAQVHIREDGSSVTVLGRDMRTLGSVRADAADAVAKIVKLVNHWARWFGVMALANPNPALDVELTVRRVGDPPSAPPPAELEAGKEKVTVSITNRSGTKLYAVLVALAEEGSIVTVPPSGPPITLASDTPYKQTFAANLPAGWSESRDVVKVIASTQPIPTNAFRMEPAPSEQARAVGSAASQGDALARLLKGTNVGLARSLDPVEIASWTTREATLNVVRSVVPRAATLDAVALHYPSAEVTGNARARSVGPSAAKPLPGLDTTLIVRQPAARGTDGKPQSESVGRAFERAYTLGDEMGAERAEPLFEVDVPSADGDGARSVFGSDAPRACEDALWSLRASRVSEAWERIRTRTGLPPGQEARGVVIAHVDTGYRPHPEIWTDDPATRTVWPEVGWDYFDGDPDPTDDLLSGQVLDNPAHGTGSGSAITSPAGSQTPTFEFGPTGAALGARLVPLRVHRSVVHFNTERLVEAIGDASGSDRTHVKVGTDFISLSMGGIPTWTLWRAVRRAEERGYLIIAAAGNYVRTVVWPARFDSVLAVGATNVACTPWASTSRGSAVDVSAPGEAVCRAMLEKDAYITSVGTGTTYGTASTAGIAGLWFAYHRGSPEFEALRQNHAVARVFRHLVAKTAWQPGNGTAPQGVDCNGATWQPGRFGAGIVDAAALLDTPLEEPPAPRSAGAATPDDLPLFGSLYDDGTSRDTIRADYRRLFKSDADDRGLRFESEIMHHYFVARDVAAALDQIAVRGDRSEGAFTRAREALRARDLSARLRGVLG